MNYPTWYIIWFIIIFCIILPMLREKNTIIQLISKKHREKNINNIMEIIPAYFGKECNIKIPDKTLKGVPEAAENGWVAMRINGELQIINGKYIFGITLIK